MATKQELENRIIELESALLKINKLTEFSEMYTKQRIYQLTQKALNLCVDTKTIKHDIIEFAVSALSERKDLTDSIINMSIQEFCRHKSIDSMPEYQEYLRDMSEQEYDNLITEIKAKITKN